MHVPHTRLKKGCKFGGATLACLVVVAQVAHTEKRAMSERCVGAPNIPSHQRHCVGVRYPSSAHGLLGLAHGQASARNPCMLIFVIELINHLKMCVCLGALESITQAPMGCTIGCHPPHTYFGMVCEFGHQTLHAWDPCMHLTMCKLKSPWEPLGWL